MSSNGAAIMACQQAVPIRTSIRNLDNGSWLDATIPKVSFLNFFLGLLCVVVKDSKTTPPRKELHRSLC